MRPPPADTIVVTSLIRHVLPSSLAAGEPMMVPEPMNRPAFTFDVTPSFSEPEAQVVALALAELLVRMKFKSDARDHLQAALTKLEMERQTGAVLRRMATFDLHSVAS